MAGILANTNWAETLEEKVRCYPTDPTSQQFKQMRSFLRAVKYYTDLHPRKAHLLKPLLDKHGAKSFSWTEQMNTTLKVTKALMLGDCLMKYPNHHLRLQIYTDLRDYQTGACIMQKGVPVAYWSITLTSAQKNYTTIEKGSTVSSLYA